MSKESELNSLYDKLVLELRRGAIVLAVLSQVDEPQYGYSLIQRLSENGMEIDQGTLYPLLRRLEDQGLLASEWKLEGSRPRRYYVISEAGRQMLERLAAEWRGLNEVMGRLMGGAGSA